MDKGKNQVRLAGIGASATSFQPLHSHPVSTEIRSVLEVIGKHPHLCCLSKDGKHLVLLEHQSSTAHRAQQQKQQQQNEEEGTDAGTSSSQPASGCDQPTGSLCGGKTLIFYIDLWNGRCSRMKSIDGLCTTAVFHSKSSLLAVLQPPKRVLVYHVERGCWSEVVEFNKVSEALQGVQWLPQRRPGALPPARPPAPVSSAGPPANCSNEDAAPALLGFAPQELVIFGCAGPSQWLPLEPPVCWAGAVLGGSYVAVVRCDAGVQLLPLCDGAVLQLCAPPHLAPHLPVVCVFLMPCETALLVMLQRWHVMHCDLQERTTSLITLQVPASPAAVRAMIAAATSHSLHSQVVLVLDTAGAVHVFSAASWHCLRTVQSPRLKVESMSVCSGGELLCLTYSNHTSKLYHLLSLLRTQHFDASAASKTKASGGKENRRDGVRPPGTDSTAKGVSQERSETDGSHRVHFEELLENGSMCTASKPTKSSGRTTKRAACHPEWRKLLEEFGSFPSKERAAIWSGLLTLPRCSAIYCNLASKPLHQAVPLYSSMADQALRDAFRRTLSCLYYWAPQLSSVPWVPSFVFPFVKSLQHAPLVCFELCVALLVSWCRLWFSPAPEALVPPVLNTIEVLVCDSSPRLMASLVHSRITADVYAWPLLSTAFAQVLSAEDWAVAWDHLLCQPPSFLLCFTAAYTLCLAPSIRAAAAAQHQIKTLYSQESYLPVRTVLKKASELHSSMKLDDELLGKLDAIAVFPEGGLPVFDNIPRIQVLEPSSKSEGDDGGMLQSLGWSLEEAEFERERAALREREDLCIATMKLLRKSYLSSS